MKPDIYGFVVYVDIFHSYTLNYHVTALDKVYIHML